jgi:hypothetical protein
VTDHVRIETEVASDKQLRVQLPDDFPAGPVEVEVMVKHQPASISTFGALLRSEFFGMWADRGDITDSETYSRSEA